MRSENGQMHAQWEESASDNSRLYQAVLGEIAENGQNRGNLWINWQQKGLIFTSSLRFLLAQNISSHLGLIFTSSLCFLSARMAEKCNMCLLHFILTCSLTSSKMNAVDRSILGSDFSQPSASFSFLFRRVVIVCRDGFHLGGADS